MGKKILKVGDRYGWAYWFAYIEQVKYTRHKIEYICIKDLINDISKSDGYDLIYYHSPHLTDTKLVNDTIKEIKKRNPEIKIIGGEGGSSDKRYEGIDVAVTICADRVEYLKKVYSGIPVYFLMSGIDTKVFRPRKFRPERFNIGWAGRISPVKRPYLLDRLKYPVIKQCNRRPEQFVPKYDRKDMLSFYDKIDVFILLSKSEGTPRVVLEACACGIPVISTGVGTVPYIIDEEWLIIEEDENKIVEEANRKLDAFKENVWLRKKAREENLKNIQAYSWEKVADEWDNLFEAVVEDKLNELVL